jgi:hypothetical protein
MEVNGPISEELKELETERICKKSIEPALSEMTELIAAVKKRCSNLEDELKQVRSLVDALIILNLERTHRWQGIRVG